MHENKCKELGKMRRQRNMLQLKKKKQDKTSEKELNKMEISNLPDMKFGHKDAHQTQEKNA